MLPAHPGKEASLLTGQAAGGNPGNFRFYYFRMVPGKPFHRSRHKRGTTLAITERSTAVFHTTPVPFPPGIPLDATRGQRQ